MACPAKTYLDRGTSLTRNTPFVGPFSRTIPRVMWWSQGRGLFLMSEAPLHYRVDVTGTSFLYIFISLNVVTVWL